MVLLYGARTHSIKNSELKICLPAVIALELISPYLNYFNTLHPEIKLNLLFISKEIKMEEDDIDLAIVEQSFVSGINNKYVQKFLRFEYIQLYCTPEYAQKNGIPLDVDQLKNHNVICGVGLYNEVLYNVKFVNKYTGDEVIYNSKKDSLKMNSPTHALEVGLCGNHIFHGWEYVCDPMVKKGELIEVIPDYYVYIKNFYLVSRRATRPVEQIFIDFIYRCMNKNIIIDALSMMKHNENINKVNGRLN